jgi:8-amino-7-oxononanoate synthase
MAALQAQGRLRLPRASALAPETLILCSNDYLGWAREPLAPGALEAPSGAGASRLVSGDHAAHRALEAALADWLGCEAALVFSSGYAANVGLIAALAGEGDLVVSDALNHASLIDGARLSRATVRVVPHLDADAVERALAGPGTRRRFVVTESYFSMDGRGPDLGALRAACDRHDAALVVDEAHALGVFGPAGRGRLAEAGVTAEAVVGTLGKAIGLAGAFVAGTALLRTWLWNRARSFVFSTGLSPSIAAAAVPRVAAVARDDAARARLGVLSARARRALADAGAPIAPSFGPILPWIVGRSEDAVAFSDRLLARGLFVQAIRPPTVPDATARLRLSLTARLSDAELDRALGILCEEARR